MGRRIDPLQAAKDFFNFIIPEELHVVNEGMNKKQIEALNHSSTVSKLLLYRSYFEHEDLVKTRTGNGGLYQMADGRIGMVMRVYPPPYLSKSIEGHVSTLLNNILHDDTVVHFFTFASRNIKSILDDFEQCHSYQPKVKNPEVLRGLIKSRKEEFMKWSQESMIPSADFRLRDFHNIVSILFPHDMPQHQIIQQYNTLMASMEKLHAENMPADKLVPLIREVLNPGAGEWSVGNDQHRKMNTQMAKGASIKLDEEGGGMSFGGGWRAKVLTTDAFPETIEPEEYQRALFDPFGHEIRIALPGPFILSLTVVFKNTVKQKKKVRSKMKWNVGNLAGIGYVTEKQHPEIKEKRLQCQEALQYIDMFNEVPLDGMWSLTVFADSDSSMDSYIAQIRKNFSDIPGQWKLREESSSRIAFQSMLMGLPLQYLDVYREHLKRFELLFRSNNVSLAPMISDIKGFGRPVMMYIGRTGQLQSFDPMASSGNYNVNIVGPMGSGKSFLTNDFLTLSLAAGFAIRMIDTGYSYKPTCDAIGGQYLQFDGRDICMNFFTNAVTETREIEDEGKYILKELLHEDELSTMVPLVGMMAGIDLTMQEIADETEEGLRRKNLSSMVAEAVRLAFRRRGRDAGMKDVGEVLEKIYERARMNEEMTIVVLAEQLIGALRDYTHPEGRYYNYFNGVNNIEIESDYFILEMEELKQKVEFRPVVALAMMQRFASEAFFNTNPMIIGVDEAKDYMKNVVFSSALSDFSLRFRKYHKILLVVTQLIDHFFVNPNATDLFEASSFKIFLQQQRETVYKAKKKGQVAMTEFEKDLMLSVQNRKPHFGEMMVMHDGSSAIMRLKVPSFSRWLYSTDPREKKVRAEVQQRYNFSMLETVTFLAIQTDNPDLVPEEVLLRTKETLGGNSDVERMTSDEWVGMLTEAIDTKAFTLFGRPIVKTDTQTLSMQSIFPVMNVRNRVFSPVEYVPKAIEAGLFVPMARAMMEQVFSYAQFSGERFTFFMDREYLSHENLLTELLKNASSFGVANRMTVEIPMGKYSVDERHRIVSFFEDARKLGVFCSVGRISKFNMDPSILFDIRPDIIRVDGSALNPKNSISADDEAMARMVVAMCHSMDLKITAFNIRDEETLRSVLNEGVTHVEGNFIGEAKPLDDEMTISA